jgi:hypothetical protein
MEKKRRFRTPYIASHTIIPVFHPKFEQEVMRPITDKQI